MGSVADLEARAGELRTEIKDINAAHEGEMFPDEVKARWKELNQELEQVTVTIEELSARQQVLEDLSRNEANVENEEQLVTRYSRGPRTASRVPDDPTRFEDYRKLSGSLDELTQARRDGARKIIERSSFRFGHPSVSREEAQDDIDKLIGRDEEVASRVIFTSSPDYRKEFVTYMKTEGQVVGPEMQRAASLTTTAGGFAVPVELDTTLILTNAGVVNPIRNLARVRQTNVNTVEFINTTGVVAGFGAEATEASDNAPSLQQPTVNIEKAFAFIPGSIEIFQDWEGIQEDLSICLADAKNQLESTKFLTGLGHASHEPQGLIAVGGATNVITSAGTAVFALADVYSLSAALSPRFRANATLVGNRSMFDKARQFNTAGTYGAWVDLADGRPATLTGYPVQEWSAYSAAVTTTGATVATLGDFSMFAICDRVGLSIEYIPHLFGGSNRFPTGQRALYAFWRTSSQVLSQSSNASTSAFQSLKLL